jgi:hypothetical protein
MSDVTISTADPFTVTLVEKWMTSKDLVDTIDEKMNVESFGRTKLLNSRYAEANPGLEDLRKSKPTSPFAEQLRTILNAEGLSDADFAGRYETFRRTLSEFEARLDQFVKDNVPEVNEADKPKEEELVALREERKKHVDNMNGIRTLLEGTSPDWFKAEGDTLLAKQENKRGAVGSRGETGTRLGATFQFSVFSKDGESENVLSDRKLGAVQEFLKKEVKNVAEVRKAIEGSNPDFDWKNPPDRFEFAIAGRKVVANKITDESSAADDESDTDINELTLDVSDDDPEDFTAETENPPELFDDEN